MKFNKWKRFMAVATLALFMGTCASLQAKSTMEQQGQDPTMAKMMKLGAPGEHHKVLKALVGKWNYTVTSRMTPQAKPQEMTGTSENKWIMGNRFVSEEVKGEDQTRPFEGSGLIGYDNVQKSYTSVWIDNMTTGMMEAKSQYDPATKTFTENGTFSCPLTGEKNRKFRAVLKLIDPDHYTYEMYTQTPKGKEFKSLEIDYHRAE